MENLTPEQVEKLGWQCEEEGFIEMVDAFIPDLKAAITRGNVHQKPSVLQKQLTA